MTWNWEAFPWRIRIKSLIAQNGFAESFHAFHFTSLAHSECSWEDFYAALKCQWSEFWVENFQFWLWISYIFFGFSDSLKQKLPLRSRSNNFCSIFPHFQSTPIDMQAPRQHYRCNSLQRIKVLPPASKRRLKNPQALLKSRKFCSWFIFLQHTQTFKRVWHWAFEIGDGEEKLLLAYSSRAGGIEIRSGIFCAGDDETKKLSANNTSCWIHFGDGWRMAKLFYFFNAIHRLSPLIPHYDSICEFARRKHFRSEPTFDEEVALS